MPIAKKKNVRAIAPASNGKPLIRSFELSATLVGNVKVSITISALSDIDTQKSSQVNLLLLQMAMDSRSTFAEALSEVLLKVSATSSAILHNLK